MADEAAVVTAPDKKFKDFLSATGMPTADQVVEKETKLFQQHKQDRQPFLDQSTALLAQMKSMNDRIAQIPAPEAPKLSPLPDAPDPQYKDPTQALGSMASVLAVFGSLRTRAPMTSALNASAAAMKGFHEGDKERVAQERQKWNDSLVKGMRQNQMEMQAYTTALEKAKFDITRAQGEMRAIAAANEHNQMLAAIEAGDYQAQTAILKSGMSAGEKMANLYVKDQEHQEAQKTRRQALQIHAEQQAGARADRTQRQQEIDERHMLQRSDVGTRWFAANAQKQVKPYQETIRQADNIDANLTVGMEMPDTVKAQLKTMAGAKGQLSRWSQGLDKYTGDLVTAFFSRAEKGFKGTLSQQDVDAMKAFTANMRAVNAKEIEQIRESYRPLQKEYKIPEGVFNIPFRAGAPDLGLPGADAESLKALGISPDSSSGDIVDSLAGK